MLLPPFNFRRHTISRPATGDEQRRQSRFSHEAREFAQIGGAKSHDYIDRERTQTRADCHAQATGGVAARVGGAPQATAREGKGTDPPPRRPSRREHRRASWRETTAT